MNKYNNEIRYIYSAAGEKLRVTHLTAVPNITVPIGTVRELAPSEILAADSTDYLLGGTLTMKNGRIDKYQFEEGYCQAVRSIFELLSLRPAVLQQRHGQRRAAAKVQRKGTGQDARAVYLRLRREAVQPRHRALGQDGSALREVLQYRSLYILWR